jgi:hypothetical protein
MEWMACMLVGRVVGRVAVRLSDRLLDYLESKEDTDKKTVYYHSDADLGSGWELVPTEGSLGKSLAERGSSNK